MSDQINLPGIADPTLAGWVVDLDGYQLAQELVRHTPAVLDARVTTAVAGALHALVGLTHPLGETPESSQDEVRALRTALITRAAGELGLEVRVKEVEG